MTSARSLCCTSMLLLIAAPAFAGSWGLGTHFALSSIRGPRSAGTSTVVAWTSNAVAFQPSLRLAFSDRRHAHELLLDSGLLLVDEGGSTLSLLVGSLGYQHTFLAAWPNAPFANLGLGLYREGGASWTARSTTWGGGVGVRHLVRDGHGVLRAELRVDRLEGAADLGRPGLTTLGLRLGFDLWL